QGVGRHCLLRWLPAPAGPHVGDHSPDDCFGTAPSSRVHSRQHKINSSVHLASLVAALVSVRPSSASSSPLCWPSVGAGPATRPGVAENQVGTPGKRVGPCGVSMVSKKPMALSCPFSNNSSVER